MSPNVMYDNYSPLDGAMRNGHLNVVKFLVEHGAVVNERFSSFLHMAVAYNKLDIVQYFLDNQHLYRNQEGMGNVCDGRLNLATISRRPDLGGLEDTKYFKDKEDIIRLLTRYGANIDMLREDIKPKYRDIIVEEHEKLRLEYNHSHRDDFLHTKLHDPVPHNVASCLNLNDLGATR